MQTGQINLGFPSVGSWVTYGLGSVASSLPAYVVMTDARGGPLGGPNDWSAGFMPAAHQGTLFRSTGDPIVDLKPPAGMSPEDQRARLDALAKLNELDMQKFPGNTELAARISSYELAYRMQGCAPEAVDLNSESEATKKLYGLDNKITEPYGRQCLMARRLVERGVRFVQIFSGGVGDQNTDTWDAHGDIKSNHTQHAAEVDLPTAGLLTDLKARGLLDTTLVIMHSEFGRMPISQRGVGRDHNPGTQTVLMFGAGIKGGQVIGVERRVRLQGRGAADLVSRPARDDAAPAGPRSQEADLPVQRPRHALDRCLRHAGAADRERLAGKRADMAVSKKRGVGRRRFMSDAAAGAAALVSTPLAAQAPGQSPSPAPATPSAPAPPADVYNTDRPGSDFMVDLIKSLGIEYAAANPGGSFRALHESLVNYGGNRMPELLTCLHEESSVAMAHGYAKIEGKPMLVMAHGTVGLQHASMAVYNAYADRVPVYIVLGNILDAGWRRNDVDWTHAVQDAAAMVRDCIKWDDTPVSLSHFAESAVRAYKIAMTPPMGPVILVADGPMQEEGIPLADRARLRVPKLTPTTPPSGDEQRGE